MSHILTVAANSAIFLSSQFPWLWNSLAANQLAAVLSAFVLTVGAVLEYWEKLKLLARLSAKWLLRKAKPFEVCALRKLLLHALGPILVVVGIAGEVIFEGRTFILENRKEAQAEAELTNTKLKADEAVLEAYKTVSYLSDRRLNNPERFVEELKGKPKARVQLWYNPNDSESWTFAREIYWWLGEGPSLKGEGVGWQVSIPIPIPANAGILTKREYASAPIGVKFDGFGTRSGLTLIAKNLFRDETKRQTALGAFHKVLSQSIYPLGASFTSLSGAENPSLPDDLIIVVIGPKPSWYFGLDEQDKASTTSSTKP